MLAALLAGLTGCAVMPDSLYVEGEHTSHPLAGEPFGPRCEEDALTVANVGASWTRGGAYLDAGLGVKLVNHGFYGPPLTFNVRAGYRFNIGKDSQK